MAKYKFVEENYNNDKDDFCLKDNLYPEPTISS